MAKFNTKTNKFDWDEPAPGSFDWSLYEDGWNGKSLKINKKVKAKKGDKVYCHEPYAADVYDMYSGVKINGSKELVKNALVSINDIDIIDNDTIMLSINNGSNNVIVDLNKENQFFNQFGVDDKGTKMTKEVFINSLSDPQFKSELLGMDLTAKITSGDTEKASIWNGYVESLSTEMKEQITKKTKAYWATILSTNKGGFVVDIMNTITAFMPGSMAAANRVTDFESMVGTKYEVMVESWDSNVGFVVSRKKFLQTMLPAKIMEIEKVLQENVDTLFTGRVTGMTPFGVFVELNEYVTGMLHKTLVNDEMREAMRNNTIEPGTELQVYIHKIDKSAGRIRVILSDVCAVEREAVTAKREAEEAAEKEIEENNKKQKIDTVAETVKKEINE